MVTRWVHIWCLTHSTQNILIPGTLWKLYGNAGYAELYVKSLALQNLEVVMVTISVLLYLHMYNLVSPAATTRITKRHM
jgi:hypothetical protein